MTTLHKSFKVKHLQELLTHSVRTELEIIGNNFCSYSRNYVVL